MLKTFNRIKIDMILRFKKHLRNLTQNIHFSVFVKISSKLRITYLKIKLFEISSKI